VESKSAAGYKMHSPDAPASFASLRVRYLRSPLCKPNGLIKEIHMDKDQVKGAGKEVKGGIKETLGRATDNPKTEAEGKVEKNIGTAQRKAGEAKEAVR